MSGQEDRTMPLNGIDKRVVVSRVGRPDELDVQCYQPRLCLGQSVQQLRIVLSLNRRSLTNLAETALIELNDRDSLVWILFSAQSEPLVNSGILEWEEQCTNVDRESDRDGNTDGSKDEQVAARGLQSFRIDPGRYQGPTTSMVTSVRPS